MSGVIWIPEAEDLEAVGSSNEMSGVGGPRATLHCTVSLPTQFDVMHRVLTTKGAEPHLLYSFADDRLGQYFALDRAARSLGKSDGMPYSNNRVGSVNIQIEVVGTTDDWTARDDWRPGPNFRAMLRAVRSWGIADDVVFRFAQNGGDRVNVVRPRSLLTSTTGGGRWWGHCHYPSPEDHWDPGRVDIAGWFAAAPNLAGAPGGGTPTSPVGGGGTATPVFQEDDMQLDDKVPTTATEKRVWGIEDLTVSEALKSGFIARRWAYDAKRDSAATLEITKALATKGSALTADEITAATERGVKNALNESAEIEVRVKGAVQ